VVCDSVRAMAGITRARRFSCCSFIFLVSPMLFVTHTAQYVDPACAFQLLRACCGVFRVVGRGVSWYDALPRRSPTVFASMRAISAVLLRNKWCPTFHERQPTYDDATYDFICSTQVHRWVGVVQ
jgi:hypothetical protein